MDALLILLVAYFTAPFFVALAVTEKRERKANPSKSEWRFP